jgi:hypothetical protein
MPGLWPAQVADKGMAQSTRWMVIKEGKIVERQYFDLPKSRHGHEPIRLRVQIKPNDGHLNYSMQAKLCEANQ